MGKETGKSARLVFTADAETLEALTKIKQKEFFGQTWADTCRAIFSLGLKEYQKQKGK